MDYILLQSQNLNRLYYVDILICFEGTIEKLEAEEMLIHNLSLMQKKIKFNFLVKGFHAASADRYPKKQKSYSHQFLFKKKIDLYLVSSRIHGLSDKNKCTVHQWAFSHHLMDGVSFMMFCLEFYSLFGFDCHPARSIDSADEIGLDKEKKEKIFTPTVVEKIGGASLFRNAWDFFSFFRRLIHSFLLPDTAQPFRNFFKKSFADQPVIPERRLLSLIYLSVPSAKFKKNPGETFNRVMTCAIQETCSDMHLILSGYQLRIGVPVNLKDRKPSRTLFGNHIGILPDTFTLQFSKNYYLIFVMSVVLNYFPFRFINTYLLNTLVDFCFTQIDVLYSNMDCRMIDKNKEINHILDKIVYSCPVFENTLFSFSALTIKGKINIVVKSMHLDQNLLDNFKNIFRQKISHD
jgi:hypothetical protein